MNLGALQACVRAWRTHCLPFLPDFAEICGRDSKLQVFNIYTITYGVRHNIYYTRSRSQQLKSALVVLSLSILTGACAGWELESLDMSDSY
jgi:hypothetical protein